ncbi:72 kDa type IV collagenase [Trachymyrmex cornetzi]|uniref:72 kDa type IV collagenase n=1 Tax=Trachymyrmex cornetzi TaxID=471704 RepID=A0A151J5V2_9HYME|nr:72 kDa type IV collagenase [Trachymyrmex cornetzi]
MFAVVTARNNNNKIAKLNIEDILAIQQLYGIKNLKPTTTTTQPPPTTEITTNTPTYIDLCTLQYVDTVLVLHHRIFITYQRYVWSIDINDAKYDGPHVLNSYMDFLPDNFSLSAAYQRPSGELVLFIHDIIYMVEYPSFKLKEGWPKRLSSLGFPPNIFINTVVNTNRGQTYVIFNNNDVAQIDECNMSVRSYHSQATLRFGRINNLPILRLETSTARLSMSKSTVLNIFNLEYYVNRLISSLTAMTDNVDKKFSRLLAIASTVTKSANMLEMMYDDESFDRNNILDCELIALVFGEH